MDSKTQSKIDKFVALLWPEVKKALPDKSKQIQVLVLAHGAYESGWGVCTAAQKGHNLFNTTRAHNDSRPFVIGGDLQYFPNNPVPIKIEQRFRAFDSWNDGIKDYIAFLTSMPRYSKSVDLLMKGNVSFVEQLGHDGYYTLPIKQYVDTYNGILKLVQHSLDTQKLE